LAAAEKRLSNSAPPLEFRQSLFKEWVVHEEMLRKAEKIEFVAYNL
jgi:hypothetical protein